MSPQYAPAVAPSALSWLGIGREPVAGSPVLPAAAVPVDSDGYEPEDTPAFLHDQGIRATMGAEFGVIPGVQSATFTFGGPLFLDSWGYFLDNLLGDLSTISSGTLGTARSLAAPLAVGATSLAVSVSLGTVSVGSVIQIADGSASEVVTATSFTGGTAVSFAGTPCRFAHTTAATAALQTADGGYQHTFALLDSGTGQPPVHTLTDWTGLTPGVSARAYASATVAQMDLSGDSMGLIMAKVSGMSWLSVPAASTPPAPPGFAPPLASWRSAVTLGGAPVLDAGQWAVSCRRQLVLYWNAGNAQAPYVIARGPLAITGGLDYTVPSDEGPLNLMLADGPLPLAITAGNNLTGASALTMAITCSQVQAVKAKPIRGDTLIGYQDGWVAIDNSTDTGGSGGLGPGTVVLGNNIAAY